MDEGKAVITSPMISESAKEPLDLKNEQETTLLTRRRDYGLLAQFLFMTLNLFYGRKRTISKFKVLEVIARVPYQAWEHVAYIAMTHTYSMKPSWSYALNADFEDHAEHEYMEFVEENPALDDVPFESDFKEDYGDFQSVADLFRRVGLDERIHKEESLSRIESARFS
ncbi:MAG: hypothetical protein A3C47_06760 [Omnitrophica bacterium RIFCSPHIGHO2_02_FULL_51_18]|nr:MAG: hypothetical protein A3C47_06760 [Omnitrophica bacterium RIFCSPHIGHO2_02_FULL_51_18]